MAYDGFISYSHAADGRLAPALQRGLQRLAKPWNSRRALRIFRDETGLSTNPHLWTAIEQALDESEWFVLLASPESAQSVWVGKEVAHWLETKSVDRILPVVTDGTWEWDAATGDFTPESSAVPDALRGALVEEPRHLDLAWARDETDLDLRNSRFRSAIADLAAPMHGIAKDDLEGEDIRLQQRARLLARGGVAALALLLVISLVASVFAIGQRNTANHQTALAKADAAQARQELLISQSQGALATDRQLATLLAIEADRESPSAASEDALLSAVLAEPRLQQSFAGPTGVLATLVDNRVAIVAGTTAQVWDYRTGKRQAWPSGSPLPTRALWLASTGDGSVLAVLAPGGMVWFYSGQTLQPLGKPLATGLTSAIKIKFSLSGSSLAVWGTEDPNTPGHPVFADYTGQGANWVPAPAPHGLQVTPRNVDFSTDGSVIVSVSLQSTGTGTGSDLTITDVATGEVLKTFVVSAAYDVALDWGRQRVVVSRIIGGAPGDASWYDLTQPVPTEHVISLGLSPIGSADLGYDASHTVLGINGSAGFMALDANTMAPVPGTTEINTGTQQGPVRFLDPNNLLLATVGAGPVSRWDLTGNSVLSTQIPATYNLGIEPTSSPNRFLGLSTLGPATSVTVLDAALKPVGPAIPVQPDVASLTPVEQTFSRTAYPTACIDPHSGDIATIAESSGDLVIRSGTAPFPVIGQTPGVVVGPAPVDGCTWRPDGRQIAFDTYPQDGSGGVTSIGLYDVASHTLVTTLPFANLITATVLIFSADSRVLWVGGPSATPSLAAISEITNLDGPLRVHTAFPGASGFAIEPNGRLVVIAGNTVRRYDPVTLAPLSPPLVVRSETAYDLSSTDDGRQVLISSLGGWRLVDLDAQQPVGPELPMPFQAAALVGGSGPVVFTIAGTPGPHPFWDLAPATVRAVACAVAGRNLTATEWQHYLPDAGPRHRTCAQYPLN